MTIETQQQTLPAATLASFHYGKQAGPAAFHLLDCTLRNNQGAAHRSPIQSVSERQKTREALINELEYQAARQLDQLGYQGWRELRILEIVQMAFDLISSSSRKLSIEACVSSILDSLNLNSIKQAH